MKNLRTLTVTSFVTIAMVMSSVLILSGCDSNQVLARLSEEWDAAAIILGTGPSNKTEKVSAPTGKGSREEIAATQNKQNAELLQEVYLVVYAKAAVSQSGFGSLVAALNQGASLEGVYNGIVHSADFRKLESDHPGASPMALRFFSEELARTELEMSSITIFPSTSAQPLSAPVEPLGTEEENGEIDFPGSPTVTKEPSPSPSVVKPTERALMLKYYSDFSGASFYTLKRVLGDELLRLCAEKSGDQKELAKWYGAWVNRMDGLKIDFGLALRNNPDPELHRGWAMSVSSDRLRWEVLNRIHRVINQFEVSK
jgi:hypothetical protein